MPDPRDRPADKQTQADQKHAPLRDEQSDFLSLLKLWRVWNEQREQLSRAKLRAWCKENYLSYLRLTEWHDVHGQVMEVVKGELALKLNAQPAEYAAIHRALLAGLLSQVAERGNRASTWAPTAASSSSIRDPGSSRRGRCGSSAPNRCRPPRFMRAPWRASIRKWVEEVGAHLVKRQHYEPHWERRAARAAIYERVTLFGLTLVVRPQRAV